MAAVVQTRHRCSGVSTQPASFADRPILFRPYFHIHNDTSRHHSSRCRTSNICRQTRGFLSAGSGAAIAGVATAKIPTTNAALIAWRFMRRLSPIGIVGGDHGEMTREARNKSVRPSVQGIASACDRIATSQEIAFGRVFSVFFCLRAPQFLAYSGL